MIKTCTEDFERFLMSLRGMDPTQLATLVALATTWRINLEDGGDLPHAALGVGTYPLKEQAFVLLKISNFHRKLQSDREYSSAAAITVWWFTLRACNMPELALFGRHMWKELTRGFPAVPLAYKDIEALSGVTPPQRARETYGFVPPGLEPL